MSTTRLEGFEYSRRRAGDCDYLLAEIGEGPVVLLLHGFPETHVCWEEVGREAAATHRVLLCDLRGYGARVHPLAALAARASRSERWPPSWRS